MEIARRTGFDRRTVMKWIRADALPERSAAAPKTTSATFGEMAQSEMQDGEDYIGCSEFATCRPLDRMFDLANWAAALCIKPRGLLTGNQAAKVDAMKKDWPEFATMRRLALRFRGMLKSKNVDKLGAWLRDAQKSGLYAMQRFARTAPRDIDAVRNAITEPWSNGQTEGQINRLKALKRTMYGRAGPELLSGHRNRK
jgi:hypothetical protein